MATPSSDNLYLGSGEIWFNRFDATGAKTQWRHLGDVSKFEVTPNVTTAEKYGSMNGARGLMAQAITQTGAEGSMTLSEFDADNLALGFLGATTVSGLQTAGTATDTAITGTVKKGYALDTGKKKIVVTAVKKGASTLVLGTDYSVDSDSGLITALAGGVTLSDGDTITWTGTYPNITTPLVKALSNAIIKGQLRFRSASDATGPRMVVDIWKASIQPDGALGFLGTEFGEIGLKFSCLQDTTQASDNQFYQAQYL
jgi:hypothetical protein